MKNQPIAFTIHKWAISAGISRPALESALARSGHRIIPNEKIPFRIILTALTGDKDAAMTRKLLAEAEAKERENRIADSETIAVEEANRLLGVKITAGVQSLDSIAPMVPGLTLDQRQILVGLVESAKDAMRQAR